nr:putative protease Do-like 14 [Populus alba]
MNFSVDRIPPPPPFLKKRDDDTNLAALKVSLSVVCLAAYDRGSGEKCFACTGTIVECEGAAGDDGKFEATILTSASLFHSYRDPSQITVEVHLSDGSSYEGEVSAFDLHYNIATVKFKPDKPPQKARLKWIDDSMSLQPDNDHTMVEANFFNLCPGDKVIALARVQDQYHHKLLVSSGDFSIYCCGLDCQELLMTTCEISTPFIGGPLINWDGEVIGINFFWKGQTPFLPINIAFRCLDYLNKKRSVPHPWLGMEFTNLYAADVVTLEEIVQLFPLVCKGVIVEEVTEESPADRAEIQPNDVIIKCDREVVSCSLKFFGMIWDKVGKSMELEVMRVGVCGPLKLAILADDLLPDSYNSWPIYLSGERVSG